MPTTILTGGKGLHNPYGVQNVTPSSYSYFYGKPMPFNQQFTSAAAQGLGHTSRSANTQYTSSDAKSSSQSSQQYTPYMSAYQQKQWEKRLAIIAREIAQNFKVETRLRNSIVKQFLSISKKIKKEMDKEYKDYLKPIPDGYFRSVHNRRIIKDTPQNRYKETLPYESPKEKAEKRTRNAMDRLEETEAETDDRVRHAIVRSFGIATLQEWNLLDRQSKVKAIIASNKKQKKVRDAYKDTEVKRQRGDGIVKPVKARTTLKYVNAPSMDESDLAGAVEIYESDYDSDEEQSETSDTESTDSDNDSKESVEVEEKPVQTKDEPYFETDWDFIIDSSRVPLRDYQITVVKWLKDHHGVVAAFDVGSGKTLTAAAASVCLLETGTVKKVIVVAPKSLFDNFNKELDAFLGDTAEDFLFNDAYSNYTHQGFVNMFKDNPQGCDDTLLIIDEASEFRTQIKDDGSGKSAFTVVNCCIRAKRVLLLTATPLVNDFSDITNLVAMARGDIPLATPVSLSDKIDYLRGIFAFHTLGSNNDSDDANGTSTVDGVEIDKRRLDADAPADLPTKRYHTIEFEMSDDYYKKYLAIQRSQYDSPNAKKTDPFAFLTGLRHATNSIFPNPKIEWALDRVAELKLKTVLYSAFIEDGIRLLEDGLEYRGVSYVAITGEMDIQSRLDAVRRYNDRDSGVNVLIISKAGSLGLDLKETREVILIEASWNPAQEEQVEGRACRIGSHTSLPPDERYVDIYRLVLIKPPMDKLAPGDQVPSADSLLRGIIETKRKNLDRDYLLLKSVDIDPVKALKFQALYEERYMNDFANKEMKRAKDNEFEKSKREHAEFMKKAKAEAERNTASSKHTAAEAEKQQRELEAERKRFAEATAKYQANNDPYKVMMTLKDPYEILGVEKNSSEEDCRKALKSLAMSLHPDRNYQATHEERLRNETLFKRAVSALDYITGRDTKPMF